MARVVRYRRATMSAFSIGVGLFKNALILAKGSALEIPQNSAIDGSVVLEISRAEPL
jgi:hypothetical protein